MKSVFGKTIKVSGNNFPVQNLDVVNNIKGKIVTVRGTVVKDKPALVVEIESPEKSGRFIDWIYYSAEKAENSVGYAVSKANSLIAAVGEQPNQEEERDMDWVQQVFEDARDQGLEFNFSQRLRNYEGTDRPVITYTTSPMIEEARVLG